MRVYVSGNDLWEVSKINDGWDPEASVKFQKRSFFLQSYLYRRIRFNLFNS